MKVTLSYHDTESFTVEEVVCQAIHNYGRQVKVEITPESTKVHDLIYFGLQQMVTHQQLSILYDRGNTYQADLKKLRSEVLYKLEEILNQVIIDNESKVT